MTRHDANNEVAALSGMQRFTHHRHEDEDSFEAKEKELTVLKEKELKEWEEQRRKEQPEHEEHEKQNKEEEPEMGRFAPGHHAPEDEHHSSKESEKELMELKEKELMELKKKELKEWKLEWESELPPRHHSEKKKEEQPEREEQWMKEEPEEHKEQKKKLDHPEEREEQKKKEEETPAHEDTKKMEEVEHQEHADAPTSWKDDGGVIREVRAVTPSNQPFSPPEVQAAVNRARTKVDDMTDDEKLSLLSGINAAPDGPYIGEMPGVARVGLPGLRLNDGPQGFRCDSAPGTSTQWPSALTVASSWSRDVMTQWATAMGKEFVGKGANVFLGPGVNLARVPRGGRNFE